jgi:hypothetical protein
MGIEGEIDLELPFRSTELEIWLLVALRYMI